ncbi:MAG: lamin tail domain-containing protein, partial [Myxococcales bacterium]
ADFATATPVTLGTPKAPGAAESFEATNLTSGTAYHFALQIRDGAGNASFATVTGTTATCPRGYTGALCDSCATGFRETSPGVCEDFCTNPDPCNPSPAPACGGPSGDVILTYPTTRTCTPTTSAPYFSCQAPAETDCAASGQACFNATCVANPCANVRCNAPPATCSPDLKTLTTTPVSCERVVNNGQLEGQCVQGAPVETDCFATSQVCHTGACRTAHPPAAGELVISEVLYRSSLGQTGEWFEVYNPTGKLLDLSGLKVEIVGGASFSLPLTPRTLVGPGAYFVFGHTASPANNGGAHVDYAWGVSNNTFRLDAVKHLRLTNGTTVIADLDYGSTAGWASHGVAVNLSSATLAASASQKAW